MIVTFDEEDPCAWMDPIYRRRSVQPYMGSNWDRLARPALDTMSTLSQMLHLSQMDQPQAPRWLNQCPGSSSMMPHVNRDRFEVKLNVQQFAPHELDVKLVDNCIVVQGKHEEKQDEHGFVSRQFVRRYQLPDDVKPEAMACNISSDGILCISAPRKVEMKEGRSIPITSTGQPALEKNQAAAAKQEEKPKKTEK